MAECNYETIMNCIKMDEQLEILELITKLMLDKRTTLISTIKIINRRTKFNRKENLKKWLNNEQA